MMGAVFLSPKMSFCTCTNSFWIVLCVVNVFTTTPVLLAFRRIWFVPRRWREQGVRSWLVVIVWGTGICLRGQWWWHYFESTRDQTVGSRGGSQARVSHHVVSARLLLGRVVAGCQAKDEAVLRRLAPALFCHVQPTDQLGAH